MYFYVGSFTVHSFPFFLFPFMIMDLPYICDDQVGYSAGGFQWTITLKQGFDCTFHLFPLLIFFSNWLLSALNSTVYSIFFVSLYDNGSIFVDQVGYSAGGYSLSPRWFLSCCLAL